MKKLLLLIPVMSLLLTGCDLTQLETKVNQGSTTIEIEEQTIVDQDQEEVKNEVEESVEYISEEILLGTWNPTLENIDEINLNENKRFTMKYDGRSRYYGYWSLSGDTLKLDDTRDRSLVKTYKILSWDSNTLNVEAYNGKSTWTKIK